MTSNFARTIDLTILVSPLTDNLYDHLDDPARWLIGDCFDDLVIRFSISGITGGIRDDLEALNAGRG